MFPESWRCGKSRLALPKSDIQACNSWSGAINNQPCAKLHTRVHGPEVLFQGDYGPSGAVYSATCPVEVSTGKEEIMALPTFTLRQLVEAGCHFGHNTRRWNPRMKPYLYGVRDGVHIIDLQQTVPMLQRAMEKVREVTSSGGRVLFVGTKRQAQDIVAETARRCGQYYVNHRWLGGMLTNWKTISNSINRLRELEGMFESGAVNSFTKREQLSLTREMEKLDRALGGIKDMGGLPNILFIVDVTKEDLAVAEARKLGIPVVAIVDSNASPEGVDFPVPGNDDAIRAITTYCDLIAGSVLSGIQAEMTAAGVDVGASEMAPVEPVLVAESDSAQAEA